VGAKREHEDEVIERQAKERSITENLDKMMYRTLD